jgi:hypothetical protein
MSESKKVKATDPSWYWVKMEPDEDAAYWRERGHILINQYGARTRSSVPIEDDLPPTGDPHHDKRWQ